MLNTNISGEASKLYITPKNWDFSNWHRLKR